MKFKKTIIAISLALPCSGALSVFGENFEADSNTDGGVTLTGVLDFVISGPPPELFGTFNPDGGLYDAGVNPDFAGLVDTSPQAGVINDMNGPNVGFILNGEVGTAVSRSVGTLSSDTVYFAELAVSGARTPGEVPHGFSVQFVSGGTVLSTTDFTSAEAANLVFDTVSTQFDSSALPGGVSLGDDLSFRLVIISEDPTETGFLDFDNLRLSAVPEPSSVLLLSLVGGWGCFVRRRK